jgi:cytochrome c553
MNRPTAGIALVVLLTACSSASPPSDQIASPVQERMFRHFGLARDLRTFAVTGDLDRLSVTAGELAQHEETWGLPPGSEGRLDALEGAARRAAEAETLDAATYAVAELVSTCGECHLANETDLGARFQVAAPYVGDPQVRHQNYLSWVSRLLWDGLLGPSDNLWTTGAGALVGEDSYPPPPTTLVPEAVNAEAARALNDLGVQAVTADDVRTRVDLLARVWTTCADCHVQAGVR